MRATHSPFGRGRVVVRSAFLLLVGLCVGAGGCVLNRGGIGPAPAPDGGPDADADTDSDADADTDSDADTDTDGDCPGVGTDCYDGTAETRGIGTCADGVIECVGDAASCGGDVLPGDDVCDALDNDCDGARDEDFGCVRGRTDVPCQIDNCPGFATCDDTCTAGACTTLPGIATCDVPPGDFSGGGHFVGTTCGRVDEASGCGGEGAFDASFPVTLRADVGLSITVVADGWRPAVSVRGNGGCPGSDVLACATDDDGDGTVTIDDDFECDGACPDVVWVVVDGLEAADQGAFELTVVATPPSRCSVAEYVDGVTGDTCDHQDDWAGAGCGGSPTNGRDVEHWFSLEAARDVTFSTCEDGEIWDSVVYVTTVCDDGAAEGTLTCSDDAKGCGDRSAVTAALSPGVYYVVVDGRGASCGAFALESDL